MKVFSEATELAYVCTIVPLVEIQLRVLALFASNTVLQCIYYC